MIKVQRFNAQSPLWIAYIQHLERVVMSRWALLANGDYNPDYHYLGVVHDSDKVIGHLSCAAQMLEVPDRTDLRETFINTFAVEAPYRRQGYGRTLQLEALRLTAELGCYQMRSWSAFDHPENYALKMALGFAIHPAVLETPTGEKVNGVYFAKTVDGFRNE